MTSTLTIWKCWLRANYLTKEVLNDYIAEVSTIGMTLRNEDIARRIVAARTQYKYDDILNILNQADEEKRQAIAEGSSVLDGVCQITPRVSGTWIGTKHEFDPAVHKIGADMIASAALRKVFETVGVEILGVKDNVAYVSKVTDVMSGEVDGTITPGGNLIIEGNFIRVLREDGSTSGSVFFIDSQDQVHGVVTPFTQNDPSKLIITIPTGLPPGNYTLRINTLYTSGGRMLKDYRAIYFERPLTVK